MHIILKYITSRCFIKHKFSISSSSFTIKQLLSIGNVIFVIVLFVPCEKQLNVSIPLIIIISIWPFFIHVMQPLGLHKCCYEFCLWDPDEERWLLSKSWLAPAFWLCHHWQVLVFLFPFSLFFFFLKKKNSVLQHAFNLTIYFSKKKKKFICKYFAWLMQCETRVFPWCKPC